ncbi:hypothetical protein GVO57_00055 [Sphingomonas changnyeongensis]|uniref:Uncharacterized protein n=1 Tax=Sphingomonas changnyeongensis TaxID=2698679 RepID=A0A7Z2NUL0_9SPHN|nr:hypothetical protein [Sphingomonas changnyeongensis]QHL89509.1 hypothetical protein GVO57_00055 [Sphingomonas changnyeongensis]
MAQDDERARRLAAALRENLRKRKAQARASMADDVPGADGEPDADVPESSPAD